MAAASASDTTIMPESMGEPLGLSKRQSVTVTAGSAFIPLSRRGDRGCFNAGFAAVDGRTRKRSGMAPCSQAAMASAVSEAQQAQ